MDDTFADAGKSTKIFRQGEHPHEHRHPDSAIRNDSHTCHNRYFTLAFCYQMLRQYAEVYCEADLYLPSLAALMAFRVMASSSLAT